MEPIKIGATIGEAYGPAMKITDQAEADEYFEALVDMCVTDARDRGDAKDRAECIKIQKMNLGYYAGYYDNETRERVERLFKCSHPIFGSIADNGAPTPEEAFDAGLVEGTVRKIINKP